MVMTEPTADSIHHKRSQALIALTTRIRRFDATVGLHPNGGGRLAFARTHPDCRCFGSVLILGIASGPAAAATSGGSTVVDANAPCVGLADAPSHFSHVIVLFMENHPYNDI